MKNIQVIDGADNCTYDLFAINDADFLIIFPNGQDVEFSADLEARLDATLIDRVLTGLWSRPVQKKSAQGIHGTLFYGLDFKKRYYPTKKESEMVPTL